MKHNIAITTKYFGPSNVRGSRVKASYDGWSVTVSWDYALSTAANHERAARELVKKHGITGTMQEFGSLKNGYIFFIR